MKTFAITTALATTIALSATAATAQYSKPAAPATPAPTAQPQAPAGKDAQPQIKISKEASKAIIDLQKSVNANDAANIPAKVAAAQAVAKTPEDRYAIGQLMLSAAVKAKNVEAEAQAIDYIAAANFLPKNQVAGLYNSLGVEFYNAKNAPRAVQMFQQALTIDPNNVESQRLLGESQISANPREAIAAMKKAMIQAETTGQKLPESTYARAVKAAFDARSNDAMEISRKWVSAYPGTDSWGDSIAIYRNLMQPNVEGTLDLLRLLRAANALRTSGDYTLYATTAADQGNFNEAQSVIDEGLANKKVDASSRLARDIVNGLKGKPKASAAELETAAKSAKTATAMVAVGNRFYGTGNYARAADLYRSALGAGGDTNLANLHLGMALARTGDKTAAAAALNAVTGPYAGVAKYWLLFVQKAG